MGFQRTAAERTLGAQVQWHALLQHATAKSLECRIQPNAGKVATLMHGQLTWICNPDRAEDVI